MIYQHCSYQFCQIFKKLRIVRSVSTYHRKRVKHTLFEKFRMREMSVLKSMFPKEMYSKVRMCVRVYMC